MCWALPEYVFLPKRFPYYLTHNNFGSATDRVYEMNTNRLRGSGIISWSYGVTVSTLDSESSDRGSNPRRTFFALPSFWGSHGPLAREQSQQANSVCAVRKSVGARGRNSFPLAAWGNLAAAARSAASEVRHGLCGTRSNKRGPIAANLAFFFLGRPAIIHIENQRGSRAKSCRIPFGDHPLKLERYRED